MLMITESNVLLIIHNKTDINHVLLTAIDTTIAIEVIKPIFRIEHNQTTEECTGRRILKKVTTETSIKIRIIILIIARDGIEIMKAGLMCSPA